MSNYYDAFEVSPVPVPGPDAVAPEPFRGIYGMPAFVSIPTKDLEASADFWIQGLGFFNLFSVPGTIVHLRRWAFQDVLLVASDDVLEQAPSLSVSFSCVLNQIDSIVDACRVLSPESVVGPRDTFWGTRDIEIITPENARVVFSAAKQFDPASQEAKNLESMGITPPADLDDAGGRA